MNIYLISTDLTIRVKLASDVSKEQAGDYVLNFNNWSRAIRSKFRMIALYITVNPEEEVRQILV